MKNILLIIFALFVSAWAWHADYKNVHARDSLSVGLSLDPVLRADSGTRKTTVNGFFDLSKEITPVAPDTHHTRFMNKVEHGFSHLKLIAPEGAEKYVADGTLTCRNDRGCTIAKGRFVRRIGTIGNSFLVTVASSASESTSCVIGSAMADIAAGAWGRIQTDGTITNQDFTVYDSGAAIYLSPDTSEPVTTTCPSLPNVKVFLGYMLSNKGAGNSAIQLMIGCPMNNESGTAKLAGGTKKKLILIESSGKFDTIPDGTNNQVLTTDGAGNPFYSDKSGGSAGTISSINGSSEAAQTIAADLPWLQFKESGTGNCVHTLDTVWGYIVPTGINNEVDSSHKSDTAGVCHMADTCLHEKDSIRAAWKADSAMKIKNTAVTSGTYGSAKYTPQYVVGQDGRLTSSTQIKIVPDSSWKADSAMKITNIIAAGAIGGATAIPIINYNAQGRIISVSSALPDTAKDAGKFAGHAWPLVSENIQYNVGRNHATPPTQYYYAQFEKSHGDTTILKNGQILGNITNDTIRIMNNLYVPYNKIVGTLIGHVIGISDSSTGAKYWGGHLWPPTYTDVGAAPAAHGVTTNYLPKAATSTTWENSLLYDDGTGKPSITHAAAGMSFVGTNSSLLLSTDVTGGGSGDGAPAGNYIKTAIGNNINFATSTQSNPWSSGKISLLYRDRSAADKYMSALEFSDVASGYGNLLLMKSGGNVGIGITNPVNALQIGVIPYYSGNDICIGNGTQVFAINVRSGTVPTFYTNNNYAFMSSGGTGKVGIGTASPDSNLTVSGGSHLENVKATTLNTSGNVTIGGNTMMSGRINEKIIYINFVGQAIDTTGATLYVIDMDTATCSVYAFNHDAYNGVQIKDGVQGDFITIKNMSASYILSTNVGNIPVQSKRDYRKYDSSTWTLWSE